MRLFSLLLSALILQSQEAPKPTRLLGKAINAATNEPVRKASIQLQLQRAGGQNFATTTDNEGAFAFENLPPGDYRLSGEKSGFLRTPYGARTPSSRGSLITITPGAEPKEALLKLIPAAVVAGRILDEDGEPLEGAVASVLLKTEANGAIRWERRTQATPTNDRGEFRISGIPPGPIRLAVQPSRRGGPSTGEASNSIYPTTYFPGVDSLDQAQTLQLQPGQELAGLQLSLRRKPVYRIKGRYTGPMRPEDAGRMQLALRNPDSPEYSVSTTSTGIDPKDGSFTLFNVLPGAYKLNVLNYQGASLKFVGSTDVSVTSSDLQGVVIEPHPPLVLSGKLRLEQDPQALPAISLSSLRVQIMPSDLNFVALSQPLSVAADGAFQVEGIPPDRFRLNVLGPPMSTYIKSMRAGGREVPDYTVDLSRGSVQLEILLATRLASLKGVVEKSNPDHMPGFVVLEKIGAPSGVVGQSHSYGVSQNGAFDTNSIAPGDYRLYAFEELDLIYLRDPSFLKKFAPRAIELKIAEGETKTIALKQIAFAEVEAALKEQ